MEKIDDALNIIHTEVQSMSKNINDLNANQIAANQKLDSMNECLLHINKRHKFFSIHAAMVMGISLLLIFAALFILIFLK